MEWGGFATNSNSKISGSHSMNARHVMQASYLYWRVKSRCNQ
jgi:hypothetical protein